jgi:hypothetical protein
MDEPQTNPRATSRRPVWARITVIVGLVLAGTLLTSMLLTATGIGARASPMGQHAPGGGVAMDSGGDRGHDREGGTDPNASEGDAHQPPSDTGDHAGPATGHRPEGPTQEGCP